MTKHEVLTRESATEATSMRRSCDNLRRKR